MDLVDFNMNDFNYIKASERFASRQSRLTTVDYVSLLVFVIHLR